jgi:hypothetical protein
MRGPERIAAADVAAVMQNGLPPVSRLRMRGARHTADWARYVTRFCLAGLARFRTQHTQCAIIGRVVH